MSVSWKRLTHSQRSKWEAMANIDRERYEREKVAYKGPWKVPIVKHPNPPKKPMSVYLAFSNTRRKAIAKENPALTNAEISALLSKLWKECPVDLKQSYRDREALERKAFKQQMAEWERASVKDVVTDKSICSTTPSNRAGLKYSASNDEYLRTMDYSLHGMRMSVLSATHQMTCRAFSGCSNENEIRLLMLSYMV